MFQYYQPTRIHFGNGALQKLGGIARKYGSVCLMVTTPDAPLQPLYERVKELLAESGIEVLHFDRVQPNPAAEMVEEGFELMRGRSVDFVLAVGGGSSIDTAKTLAFCHGKESISWEELFSRFSSPYEYYETYSAGALPLLCIPTTSGTGSQVTQAAVITRGKEKITFYHQDLFSKECIIDPNLMRTLPARITAATGFDAFTHAFESYCNPHASAYSRMDSMEAMRLIIENLPAVLAQPDDIERRGSMALADTLAGRALANAGAGAPHPLSEIIGGITHLPHGEALAVVFPAYVKQYTAKHPEEFLQIARLFDKEAENPEQLYGYICQFLSYIGLTKKLEDYGVTKDAFQEMLDTPVLDVLPFGTREELEGIMREAYGCDKAGMY